MRIGIITNDRTSYSVKRLMEVSKKRGHEARAVQPTKVSVYLGQKRSDLYVKGVKPRQIDAIIPRIAATSNPLAIAVLRQFEQLGTFSINTSTAIAVAHDKLRIAQTMARHGIPIPESAWVFSHADIPQAIEKLGGAPIVIKVLHGSQGSGVMLAESDRVAKAMVEALQLAGHAVILQQFISESAGADIRAFVVGDRVVASMRRKAAGDDFRSNIHQGGSAEKVDLDESAQHVAVRAAHAVGLRVAGVDLIESNHGPLVIEVNASPGLEGIEGATKVDVAGAIIEFLEEEVNFPDVDLKEQLSLGKGYAISEFYVSELSPYREKTVEELGFRERGLQLLRINRGGLTLPFPTKNERLSLGDIMLFFGKKLDLTAIRSDLPIPEKKKRKKIKPK